MRESTIENYLVERVKAMGGEVRKVKWVGRNGAPDRLVMLPPFHYQYADAEHITATEIKEAWDSLSKPARSTVIWVELKAPGEKCRPHQIREHKRMRRMGQRVEVVNSFEGVDEVLA